MRLVSTIRAEPTASIAFGPTAHFGALGVERDDVERLGLPADLEPAPLADGEVDHPCVRAERLAGRGVDDPPRPRALGPHRADDPRVVAVGHEADVLAVGLGGDARPKRSAMRRTSSLGSPPSGKRRKASCSSVVP